MAKEPWIFGENFIANGVGGSYTVALIIAKFHLEALIANESDPDFMAREMIFQGLYDNLVNADITKGANVSSRITSTASVAQIFQFIIDTDLPLWQNKIAAVYPRKSSTYKGLFPRGNKSFENGRIENKIKAVGVLATATQALTGLSAVSSLITTRFKALNIARNLQLGLKSSIEGNIATQITAIDMMCDAHFIDHGLATMKFSRQPKMIASFTDVVTLQQHIHSLTYEGTVNGEKVKTAFVRKYTDATVFTVTCVQDAQVWVIDKAKNIIKPTGVFIPAGTPTEVDFPAVGDVTKRVFQIKNLSSIKAKYTIVIS